MLRGGQVGWEWRTDCILGKGSYAGKKKKMTTLHSRIHGLWYHRIRMDLEQYWFAWYVFYTVLFLILIAFNLSNQTTLQGFLCSYSVPRKALLNGRVCGSSLKRVVKIRRKGVRKCRIALTLKNCISGGKGYWSLRNFVILGFWIRGEGEGWTQLRFGTEGLVRQGPINNSITLWWNGGPKKGNNRSGWGALGWTLGKEEKRKLEGNIGDTWSLVSRHTSWILARLVNLTQPTQLGMGWVRLIIHYLYVSQVFRITYSWVGEYLHELITLVT